MRMLVLAVLAVSLTLGVGGVAHGQFASPMLCAFTDVIECGHGGECQRGTLESANLPRFIKLDPAAKSVAATGGDARTAPIHIVERGNDRLILQGGQQGRAWSAMVGETTGQMSVAVIEDKVAFVIFGACTPIER